MRPGRHLNYFLTEVGNANTFKGIELERDPADRQAISAIQASVLHDIHPREHCLDEWMSLKFHVQRVRAELELKQSDFWKNKLMFCKDDYPNPLILVELCLVIPCQTACCERGNSCMNRIMTH
ncbi:unnamed protein product [Porites evermanni]|uniref:HAT C-terminal dimerisation domain-containing protein n=1 Tax=Porites evermanni TaxID=104178 RepID=A0ABN8M9E6_9CNID|nr:unnamed protein product [Porites evermanni]